METAAINQLRSEGDPVRIICANEEIQGLREHRLEIQYPEHWFAPLALSPFAKKIEQETISWMQALGLIKDDQSLSHVQAMEPRYYAGYSHSMASYDYTLLYCKCITMWLLWDDERVEVAKNFDAVEGPIIALRGDQAPAHQVDDPYVRAFKHIGDEYERLGASKQWRQRFADRMSEWATHAIQEEVVRRNGVGNDNRSLEEAIRLRAITIGFKPASIPTERAAGIELPEELVGSEDYELILEYAAQICFIVNDIVGVPKDISNDQKKSNLVIYYMNANNVSLLDAYHKILRVHDDAVNAYDKLVASVLRSFPSFKQAELSYFFDSLRYMETGFGIWQAECIRYQNSFAAQGKQSYRISIGRRF
ncbi:terpene synthase family protein [Pseudomonas sp. GL-B-16]|uniref:terpene synthase family protein n=1 Tax=Pseudomonas sp. GL-B-16 TaxID=2832373 RepID=UPI001CC19899|nr:terpene synthase family protein [Pseudomonas sp. GL-B-16]